MTCFEISRSWINRRANSSTRNPARNTLGNNVLSSKRSVQENRNAKKKTGDLASTACVFD